VPTTNPEDGEDGTSVVGAGFTLNVLFSP